MRDRKNKAKLVVPAGIILLLVVFILFFLLNGGQNGSDLQYEIAVDATLDGQPWSGEVNYEVQGPDKTESGSSVPQNVTGLPPGNYAIIYNSGGPQVAVLKDISSTNQEVSAGETATFTLNFVSVGEVGEIVVDATLDGQPWSGEVDYTLQGPETESGASAPHTFSEIPVGNYTISYNSGGPAVTVLNDILPPTNQEVSAGETATFTLNFVSVGVIAVNTTLDGKPWAGEVNYEVQGSDKTESGSSVPQTFTGLPIGAYNINYLSGGPQGALFGGISPSTTEELPVGGTTIFILNFISAGGSTPSTLDSASTGDIIVEATYKNKPWEGKVSYTIKGPVTESGTSVPQSFSGLPIGTYTIAYNSGAPSYAGHLRILPSKTEVLSATEPITFTLAFEESTGGTPVSGADLSLTKAVDNATPNQGDNVTYTVTVINSGPDAATNVQITDILPAQVTYVSDNASLGTTYDNITGTWDVGSLLASADATLQIKVAVDAGPGTIITNTAELTSVDQGDPDSTPNNNVPAEDDQDEAIITVYSTADLAVTKNSDNSTPNEGDNVNYTIAVINNGPHTATGIQITDILPAGITYVSDNASLGTYNNITGIWDVGSIANGASANLSILVTVNVGTGGSTITNTANITAVDQDDPQPANNLSTKQIVVQSADLSVTKNSDNSTPNEGDNITYTITVTNSGPDTATGIQITDILPTEVTYGSDNASLGTYDNITGIWDVGSIANGASANLSILVTVNVGTGGSTITNTANITAVDQDDPQPANNLSTKQIVVQSADLSVTKTVDDSTPNEGDTITYTITVTNNGADNATNVEIYDELPLGVFYLSNIASQGFYDPSITLHVWYVGDIASGDSHTLEIIVIVDLFTSGSTITNTAEVTAVDQVDPDSTPGNDVLAEDDQYEVDIDVN